MRQQAKKSHGDWSYRSSDPVSRIARTTRSRSSSLMASGRVLVAELVAPSLLLLGFSPCGDTLRLATLSR